MVTYRENEEKKIEVKKIKEKEVKMVVDP